MSVKSLLCRFVSFLREAASALGGQALLGAKILVDYGFTNVKVIEGGCVAYKKAFPEDIKG